VQVSVYSHRAEIHDGITKVAGSLDRSIAAIRFLKAQGLRVLIANVLMRQNAGDYPGVQALARELGAEFTLDPTITPKMDGDTPVLALRIPTPQLLRVYTDKSLVGEPVAVPPPGEVDPDCLDDTPCSAGHTACYVSPYGDIYPCVQFPLPSGNLRRERFDDIWRHSQQLEEVRRIRIRDLPTCSVCSLNSNCTRCPGLAYMEGNMRGPSSADCEKAMVFDHARRNR
jgi:radical SAM protein with 4Fe4S-binding SPASM domain